MMKRKRTANRSRLSRYVLLTILVPGLASCTVEGSQITHTPQVAGVFNAIELEAFVDDFFDEQLDELKIPGAVFVLVRDGQVVLAKGFGLADIELEIAFDPATTIVRIGSISKLIVATAVMQLVEQGRLDLNTDVNHYLTSFQLSDEFDEPVTLAHLLTHTGGFDHPFYWTTLDHTEVLPLEPYLSAQMPPRISPPGEVLGYSSHGYDLAALIVEQVSAIPFSEYAQSNILQPLGMDHSEYLTSPPFPEGLAVGYALEGRTQVVQPIDYDPGFPSGSLVSTANDMEKFILAHLGDGCFQDACILSADTISMMHQQQFTNHAQLPGWTYGFTEGFYNGLRLIGHGGAIRGFGSDLVLVPEFDLGYFLSFNEECYLTGACAIVGRFRSQFLDLFFPVETSDPPPYESNTDLARLTGTYRYIRYPHSTIYTMDYAPYDVEVTQAHGNLRLHGTEYQEIAPLVFQQIDGQERIAFREDDRGDILYMFAPDTYERLE